MSREAVESIIGKAVVDHRFREALFANPDEALAGYELTEMELTALKAIDAETLESFAGTLDERISKAFAFGGGGGGGGGAGEGYPWDQIFDLGPLSGPQVI